MSEQPIYSETSGRIIDAYISSVVARVRGESDRADHAIAAARFDRLIGDLERRAFTRDEARALLKTRIDRVRLLGTPDLPHVETAHEKLCEIAGASDV